MDSPQNIISFCTGYGGIELGLRRISDSFRTICYVEIELFAAANLVAKIEQGKLDSAPIWTDIKTFDGLPFRGKVHGIIGGYPCQPFSNAGQRKGTDDPRHLWPYILGHIRTIRPVWCFFENVSGHLSLGFEEVAQSLRDLGYKVEAGLFTAAEVGLPHKRERLFVLAYADGNRSGLNTGTNRYEAGDLRRDHAGDVSERHDKLVGEMENSVGVGRRGRDNGEPGGQGRALQVEGSSKLANTKTTERRRMQEKHAGRRTPEVGRPNRSPARPGQPQHDWEEPRTVKPGMGRTVNGFASRVDELRLLGNGVVPATAELAFRTLTEKMKT